MDVDPSGTRDRPAGEVIEGVQAARLEPHVDHRGSLFEIVNFEHPFWQEPVVYAYAIRSGPAGSRAGGCTSCRPTAT